MSSSGSPGPALMVINADDLGRTDAVNDAVMAAFRSGLISNASIMANMPGFAEACEAVRDEGLHGQIGVHLNLTQGQAMTMPIREQPKLCRPSGELLPRGRTFWRLDRREAQAIETELAAQLEAVLAEGINPTHLDSHHHVHTQWPIGAIVMTLARRFEVPAVRLTRNCGGSTSRLKQTYKSMFNSRLARAGLARTTYFGVASDVLTIRHLDQPVEVMVHPERNPEGQVVDCTEGASRFDGAETLEQVVERLRPLGRMVSYSGLTTEVARR